MPKTENLVRTYHGANADRTTLASFQEKNCLNCFYADKWKLTGLPCCTFPGQTETKDGICLSRRI